MKKSNVCLLGLLLFSFALLKYILWKKGLLGQENVLETIAKFVKMLWKQTSSKVFWRKGFTRLIRFTCSDKCLVYLLSCKVCGRQYTGQTVDEFRYRWNNYKDNNRKSLRGDGHKQAGFFAHFQGSNHNGFLEDTEITFIDKTEPSDPTRYEEFWIDTLKTRYPLGLHNIDAYH